MKELDFDTESGRKEAIEYITELVNKEDKTDLAKLIFSMMDFIVRHETIFVNLKDVLK